MDNLFSDRIADVPRSFIREILKVAIDPSVISFAGGLPNRNLFPVAELRAAANRVFDTAGREALQYANSEGLIELREYISVDTVRSKVWRFLPTTFSSLTAPSKAWICWVKPS